MKAIEIYDYWQGTGEGRKTISKADISKLGLETINIRRYATDMTKSGEVSDKRFTNVDWRGIAKELVGQIPDDDEYGILQLAKYQYEVLGYTNMVDKDIEWRFVVVSNLNTSYSPKFDAYSINNGKIVEMKVHKSRNPKSKDVKNSFYETPFSEGDVLYIREVKKTNKRQNINGEWTEIEGSYEWWIKDYYKVI
jgi:DNA polymerase-3 subunit alpha